MPASVAEKQMEKEYPINAICLSSAVLCAQCDVVSDSPHDYCLVCGSRSLVSLSRLLGGMLPKERAKLINIETLTFSLPQRTLSFPRSHRTRIRIPTSNATTAPRSSR